MATEVAFAVAAPPPPPGFPPLITDSCCNTAAAGLAGGNTGGDMTGIGTLNCGGMNWIAGGCSNMGTFVVGAFAAAECGGFGGGGCGGGLITGDGGGRGVLQPGQCP